MDIKDMVRKALLNEASKTAYDYGCVMVYLNVDETQWDKIQDQINPEDLYNDKTDKFGRETEPHVTILYGIHGDVPDADVEEIIDEIKDPKMTVNKVSVFKNEKYDVLKFEVDSSELHKLNKKFKTLPYTSDYPDYNPHITIAYVKAGLGDEYVDKLNKVGGLEIESDKILYSKPDNTKKEYEIK